MRAKQSESLPLFENKAMKVFKPAKFIEQGKNNKKNEKLDEFRPLVEVQDEKRKFQPTDFLKIEENERDKYNINDIKLTTALSELLEERHKEEERAGKTSVLKNAFFARVITRYDELTQRQYSKIKISQESDKLWNDLVEAIKQKLDVLKIVYQYNKIPDSDTEQKPKTTKNLSTWHDRYDKNKDDEQA